METTATLASVVRPAHDDDMRRSFTCDFDPHTMLNKLSCAKTMPPMMSKLGDPFGIGRHHESEAMKRQSSMLSSFQNISLFDCNSVDDSQLSHYQPSINEPYVDHDASPEVKAMHAFLDCTGIFQVNVRQQLDSEKKQTYTASGALKQRLSLTKTKLSPGILERRARLFSKNESTAGSSLGATSQTFTLQCGLPAFSTDLFKYGSLPKSVKEEPNSGNSTGDMHSRPRRVQKPCQSLQVNAANSFLDAERSSMSPLNILSPPTMGSPPT